MNKIVKDYFKNYGLPKAVLQNINDQISITDESTDEEITAECAKYDLLARSFQSEVDSRVAAGLARRRAEGGNEGDPISEPPVEPEDQTDFQKLEAMIAGLNNSITELKSEKVASSLKEKATNQLKEIKMTDSEIKGLLFGRSFKTEDEVSEFVQAQSEIHAETLKDRKKEFLGNGTEPTRSFGKADITQFTSDVEAFRESIKNN